MATYPILSPTLAALAATKNDPADSEDPSKIGEIFRQERNWLVDYLGTYFDTSGLKAGALGAITPGRIQGSDALTNAQGDIKQGSIREPDLADGCVTTNKIGLAAVYSTNIGLQQVESKHIVDGAITLSKLSALALTDAQFVDNTISGGRLKDASVGSEKFADGAVRTDSIQNRSVDGRHLPECQVGQILVGGTTIVTSSGTMTNVLAPVTMTGAMSIDANGLTRLNLIESKTVGMQVVAEVMNPGVSSPAPSDSAAQYFVRGRSDTATAGARGTGTSWRSFAGDPTLVDYAKEGRIQFKTPGVYLVTARACGMFTSSFKAVLKYYADPDNSGVLPSIFPSPWMTAYVYDGASYQGVHTTASVDAMITVSEIKNPLNPPYLTLLHWLPAAGAGIRASSTGVFGGGGVVGETTDDTIASVMLVKIA